MKSLMLRLFFLFVFTTPVFGETEVLAGKIWDVNKQAFISFTDLRDQAADARFIVLGERHGRHAIQNREAFLIGALAEQQIYPTIALEMLTHAETKIVRAYRQHSPEYSLRLALDLNWSENNWPAWNFYHPIFDMAFAAKLKLVGADLTDTEKEALNSSAAPLPDQDDPRFKHYKASMIKAHCGLIDEERANDLARLQMARDQSMAKTLMENEDPDFGAILIAGASHASKPTGVPFYLPAKSTLTIYLFETEQSLYAFDPETFNNDHLKGFDILWFTPKVQSESICDRLAPASQNASQNE